ncbi:MAG: DUF2490 domain-containing protein [Pseudomonadota bacterium]
MKKFIALILICAASTPFRLHAQVVTPEAPDTTPGNPNNVTLELVYAGISKALNEKTVAQGYLAYGYDDDLALAIGDLGRVVNKSVQVGARYLFFASDGNSDQHSFWAYVNAEKYLNDQWRVDTRQVMEYRLDTSGVDERTRYRPRFRISYFDSFGQRNYQIYASVEPIWNLTDNGDDQVSWATGGFLQLSEHAQLNVFYQFTEAERGPDFHFPGVGVLFSF